jgi:excisionase family DNA binding protein
MEVKEFAGYGKSGKKKDESKTRGKLASFHIGKTGINPQVTQSGRFLEKSSLFGTKRLILAIHQYSLWRLICGTVSGFRVSRRPSGFYRKHDERRTKAMDERWLTVDDICKYLNVSNETVYKWIEQRAMPGHRVGRRWMFKQDEVDEWVRSGGAADKSDKPDTEQ